MPQVFDSDALLQLVKRAVREVLVEEQLRTPQASGGGMLYIKDVMELLGISYPTALKLISGGMPAQKVGGKWVVPRTLFDEWQRQQAAQNHM